MNKKSLWLLRVISAIIDLSIIYSLSILLQRWIWKFIFLDFPVLFTTIFIIYYILSYHYLRGKTPAKILTGLKLVLSRDGEVDISHLLLREMVLKGGIGVIFPIYIFKSFFQVWWPLLTSISVIIVLLFSFIFLLICKKPWWELFSNTRSIKEVSVQKTSLRYSFIFISILIVFAINVVIFPFVVGKENFKSSFYPKYPSTGETIKYADFIKHNTQDPSDYIFKLFSQYDIVVISERMHPEYTQYELISKIVSDKRFITDVGNIFTECGSISFQDSLNSLLTTAFKTEEQLNWYTASLQRNSNAIWPLWSNTNLFDFLKTVNKLNAELPDSTKINWRFTDLPVDWQTMTHEKFYQAYTNPLRDSIMAEHILQPYKDIISKQKRHKALVIMNTRHGYGLFDKSFSERLKNEYNSNTTAFLERNLPGKIANVMMNTVSIKYGYMFTPVQNGKWETAFSIAGNLNAGFNFTGSPFGDDNFDVAFFYSPSLTYKDVFTGFIFYKPLEEHLEKDGFPCEFDNFEDTILRRSSYVSKLQADGVRNQISYYKQHKKDPVSEEPQRYALLHNLIEVIIIPAYLFLCLLISLLFFIVQFRKNSRLGVQ